MEPTFTIVSSCTQMLQPFKHNVAWAFLAKKLRHQTLLYSGFSGKIGKMEYLRRYFNRLRHRTNAGHGSFNLSHKTLSNNAEEKNFDFLFLTTLRDQRSGGKYSKNPYIRTLNFKLGKVLI